MSEIKSGNQDTLPWMTTDPSGRKIDSATKHALFVMLASIIDPAIREWEFRLMEEFGTLRITPENSERRMQILSEIMQEQHEQRVREQEVREHDRQRSQQNC